MNTQFEIAKESKQPQNTAEGKNFKKVDLGGFTDFGKYIMENKELNMKNEGKLFLHDLLNLTGCEISINYAPVGYKVPFKHTHKQNEEVYIILKGKGVFEIDGEKMDIQEGSVLRVASDGVRTMENTSDGEMIFMVIQTKMNSLEQFTLTDAQIV